MVLDAKPASFRLQPFSLSFIFHTVMPQGVNGIRYPHNARLVSDNKRQEIILALASGESKYLICRRLHAGEHTVDVIEQQSWQEVADRKAVLLAQAERNAMEAGHQIAEALAKRKFKTNALPVVYGICVDKICNLSPPPQDVTSQHLHLHLAPQDIAGTFNSMLANLQQRTRSLRDAQASDSAPLPAPVLSDSASAPAKQPRSVPKKARKSGSRQRVAT
jgi:hypothetical protein